LAAYGSLLVDPAHGETPPLLYCNPECVKTHGDASYTGPRFKEVMKYGVEKIKAQQKKGTVD